MDAKIGMVSLGCAKNLINSEQMMYLLRSGGYSTVSELSYADVVIVNTCGFIESAKSEAIDNILEFAELKKEGRLSKIIVAGCLAERYKEEILTELPEVDALIGCGSFDLVNDAVRAVLNGENRNFFGDINAPVSETDRLVSTGPGWAYLKIAEGCDNCCSYCAIPAIRGRYRSRPVENIIKEAGKLAENSVKELIIVAQDTTRYGLDLYGKRMLPDLLGKLAQLDSIEWIRLHYLYPDDIDDNLIEAIAKNDKIAKYLDIPIQHINDNILKNMNRRGTGSDIEKLFETLRARIPGLAIRTSVITGLPGEGDAEFDELYAFLERMKLERAGVFPYSPEEGTKAAEMLAPDRETAEYRASLIADLQYEIMDEFNNSRVSSVIKVLCEGYDRLAACFYGRSEFDSPDVDGKVFFTGDAKAGEFADVEITEIIGGDLFGVRV